MNTYYLKQHIATRGRQTLLLEVLADTPEEALELAKEDPWAFEIDRKDDYEEIDASCVDDPEPCEGPEPPAEPRRDNRLWMELEWHPDLEIRKQRAANLSALLKKLGCTYEEPVFVLEKSGRYAFTTSEAGTYAEAGDHGFWFNLDYLAKPDTYVTEAIASFDDDPADTEFQRGYLAALVAVRDRE